MTDVLAWLPPLVTMNDHGNDWTAFLEAIYQLFRRDFVDSKPTYVGKRFAVKRYPESLNKEATFWHIISTGKTEEDREIDLRRCERVGWPRPIIEAIEKDCVCVWKNTRGSDQRIVIACSDFSYVVILAEHEEYVLLWTAYVVEHDHSRRKLQKEYEAYLQGPKKS